MNSLLSRALELQHAAHELMYLGMDGEPIYSDTFCRLNKELLVKSDSLFPLRVPILRKKPTCVWLF